MSNFWEMSDKPPEVEEVEFVDPDGWRSAA